MFDPAWFQRGAPPMLEEYDKTIIAVDTASGKRQATGDYFALARLGIAGEKVWIDEIDRGRYNALKREDRVLASLGLKPVGRDSWEVVDERLWRLKPIALVIEDKGEGTDLIQRLRARHLPVRIIDAQANHDKEYRASPLAGAYRNQQVWHPAYPDEAGVLQVPRWVKTYEVELEGFPDWPHDDQVDAVAHAYNHIGARAPRVTSA
jgi:predicted phage terminase large subunit-like protein